MSFQTAFREFFDSLRQAVRLEQLHTGLTTAEQDWLLKGDWMSVTSSNVESARYLWEENQLWVSYRGGVVWSYDVPFHKAAEFYRAGSKGGWVWDNLRVRKTKHDHQVPARLEGFQ